MTSARIVLMTALAAAVSSMLLGLVPALAQSPYRLAADQQDPPVPPDPHSSLRADPTEVPPIRFLHWDLREFPGCTIPYQIPEPGHQDMDPGDEHRAVRRAAQRYSDVTPALIQLLNLPNVPGVPTPTAGVGDNRNLIMWDGGAVANTDLWGPAPSGTIGINCRFYNGRMQIQQDDIVLNDRDYQWNAGAAAGAFLDTYVDSGIDPFALADGQTLTLVIDGGALQTITFHAADFANIAAATRTEVRDAINAQLVGGTAASLGARTVGIKSNRVYDGGHTVRIVGGTARAALGFPAGIFKLRLVDVETVVVHELGHFMGLHHSTSAGPPGGPVMVETAPRDALKRDLTAEDRQAVNFLYTPDLGDAPDPFGIGAPFNQYQTRVHNTPDSASVRRTLNGTPLRAPALGPYHLFGFRGPAPFANDRFEWLGDTTDDSPMECEALPTDMFDDGVDAPDLLSPFGPNRIVITIRHTNQSGRYVRADPRKRLYFNGYMDTDFPPDGLFDPGNRIMWWEGVPALRNGTVAASPNFVTRMVGANNVVRLIFDVTLPPGSATNFYCRYRLDYGENEGRVAVPGGGGWEGDMGPAVGASQFGEVEDYPCQVYADCNENGIPDLCETDPSCCSPPGCTPAPDCNDNGLPDECEDCNGNRRADICDVMSGPSLDCDGNTIPDECQTDDLNGNGRPDECDIAAGTSMDCDNDGIADEAEDCNGNGAADACDIGAGTSQDCNGNSLPDECEPDRNGNGISDACEGPDCNANAIPDSFDISSGASGDCNFDGTPDECEDCNGNGAADACDVGAGTSADCNENGVPDECEFDANDCNGNVIPDECDIVSGVRVDCNGNHVPDACDIAAATSSDCFILPPDGTVRASLSSAGGEGNGASSRMLSISANGRYVVFTSPTSTFVAGDTNGTYDVFVRDRDTDADGTYDEPGAVSTILVSATPAGAAGNAASDDPSGETFMPFQQISADGRFIVFYSSATNLVAGDTNGFPDVFLRDRDTNADGVFDEPGAVTTTRITAPGGVQPNGVSRNASISSSGRWVAFASTASNLVTPDLNVNLEVYLWDRVTGTVRRASVSSSGAQPTTGASANPSVSTTGRYVTFDSTATTLVMGDTNSALDIFRHDRDTDADGTFDEPGAISTIRVSVDSAGVQVGRSDFPSMSSDGRWVAFRNPGPLVASDTNGADDVYLRDASSGPAAILRVSVATGGGQATGAGLAQLPGGVSPDGRYVAFYSNAANLATGDTNGTFDVFLHDVAGVQTILVSRSGSGALGNDVSGEAAVSANNRHLVFISYATNLVTGDANGQSDAFVRSFNDCNGNGLIDDFENPATLGCYGNGVPDECEADCNFNGIADSCECTGCTDQDADAFPSCPSTAVLDCDDRNSAAWRRPGEATGLLVLADRMTITWTAPSDPGGASVSYDLLRSANPSSFGPGGVCLEADDLDTTGIDGATPPVGSAYFYLAVTQNSCPSPVGRNGGTTSSGAARLIRECL